MSNFFENVAETPLDNENDVENVVKTPLENDVNSNNFTKQILNIFKNPQIHTMLDETFGKISELQSKNGSNILSHTVPCDEIENDINNRILLDLLLKLNSNKFDNINKIDLDKKSKTWDEINTLYCCANYIIKTKNVDVKQVELYRDREVSKLIWTYLYKTENFYENPSDEISLMFVETQKNCAIEFATDKIKNINLNDIFSRI